MSILSREFIRRERGMNTILGSRLVFSLMNFMDKSSLLSLKERLMRDLSSFPFLGLAFISYNFLLCLSMPDQGILEDNKPETCLFKKISYGSCIRFIDLEIFFDKSSLGSYASSCFFFSRDLRMSFRSWSSLP